MVFAKEKSLHKTMKRRLKLIENSIRVKFNISNLDLLTYTKNKTNEMEIKETELKEEIEYDIKYLKNTLMRIELAILIIMFVVVALKIVPN